MKDELKNSRFVFLEEFISLCVYQTEKHRAYSRCPSALPGSNNKYKSWILNQINTPKKTLANLRVIL